MIGDVSGKGPAAAALRRSRATRSAPRSGVRRRRGARAAQRGAARAPSRPGVLHRRARLRDAPDDGLRRELSLGGHRRALLKRATGGSSASARPGCSMGASAGPPCPEDTSGSDRGTRCCSTPTASPTRRIRRPVRRHTPVGLGRDSTRSLHASEIAETIEQTAVGSRQVPGPAGRHGARHDPGAVASSCAQRSSTSAAGRRRSALRGGRRRSSSATPRTRSGSTTCNCSRRRWSPTRCATAARVRASTWTSGSH